LSVTHCRVAPGGERAVSLVWFMPRDSREGWRHQLAVHDFAGKRPAMQLPWPQLAAYSLASSRDGTAYYIGCWDGGLWRIDADQRVMPQRLGTHPEQGAHNLAVSPDGRWLASLGPDVLQVLDLHSQRQAWKLVAGVRSFAMHPSGEQIAASLNDGRLLELDTATGDVLRLVAQLPEPGQVATFSPDGQLLAMIGGQQSLTLLDWRTGRSTWPASRDLPHRCRAGSLAFSPDSRRLVCGGRDTLTLAVWDLQTMELERELVGHEQSINGAIFLDERRIASFAADGTIRVWDLAAPGPPRVITLDVTPLAG
jgi:WD40 repeat protein